MATSVRWRDVLGLRRVRTVDEYRQFFVVLVVAMLAGGLVERFWARALVWVAVTLAGNALIWVWRTRAR